MTKAPVRLEDLFKYYKHGTPHQMAAIVELETALLKVAPDLLNRDQPWFKTWSQSGKQIDLSAAIQLCQEFEGCSLKAYPDPLSGGVPYTIGFGTTRYGNGAAVKMGDVITKAEADMLLRQEIDGIAAQLGKRIPHWDEMSNNQKSALVSFAYNLGTGFYGADGFKTISGLLHDKRWANIPAAMMLYCNPGTNVEAGLRRRRQAEGELWSKDLMQQSNSKVLSVPYQSQRDNYRDAWRTCFSTSCAMLLMTLKPGIIKSDDDYIQEVFKRGDSTDALVQIATLKHFGISASFRSNGNRDLLKKQIDKGIPVPCGFLHHGTINKPTGGGHWLIVTGYDKLGYWVNDPWGEIDLSSGNYISTNGKNLHYSYSGWEPRWMPDGPNSGWCIIA